MKLLKNGRVADDIWTQLDDDAPVPETGAIVVSESGWRRHHNNLKSRVDPVAVRIDAESDMSEIIPELGRIDALFLPFPTFTDGRSYTRARRLRAEHGYEHEIRATGDVLRDQYDFMLRCGFNAFEIGDGEDVENWQAATNVIKGRYQYDPEIAGTDNAIPWARQG